MGELEFGRVCLHSVGSKCRIFKYLAHWLYRCSGIHRGMGTHISRVKSVDLDSWTDEQLQSVLRWGNARANKYVEVRYIKDNEKLINGRYWEEKLAPGHVPSEA